MSNVKYYITNKYSSIISINIKFKFSKGDLGYIIIRRQILNLVVQYVLIDNLIENCSNYLLNNTIGLCNFE